MSHFWRNKRVLVIGGTGFIGRNLVLKLIELKAEVLVTSRKRQKKAIFSCAVIDPADYDNLSKLSGIYDVVINCAALDGNGLFKKQHSKDILDTNIRIALNILRFADVKRIPDVMLFSTGEVYSQLRKKNVKETDFTETQIELTDGYTTSKIILEILANYYSSVDHKMRIYLPRPSYVYGFGDSYSGEQTSRLVPMLLNKIINKKTITFYGSKNKKINMIYIDDLIESVLKMIEKRKAGAMNITSSEQISLSKLVRIISHELGKKPQVQYQTNSDRRNFFLNTGELQKLKQNFISLKKGIGIVVKQGRDT